ncbi:hypothetical protein [Actinokineospora pegani]|uniref:hypothetical protein n=1 Tax=Actinokineospora pegani TaxID=2654637 RepID=UPI0018D390B2|nr:hypothetical protein [Actinokineospora pegani]
MDLAAVGEALARGGDGVRAAATVLGSVALTPPRAADDGRGVSVQLPDGLGAVAAAATALDAAGIAVSEFALRQPSLDDVFHDLTGRKS